MEFPVQGLGFAVGIGVQIQYGVWGSGTMFGYVVQGLGYVVHCLGFESPPWPTKLCLVKALFFPVVIYGYESWTVKKTECRRIDAFELWCWRRLFAVIKTM